MSGRDLVHMLATPAGWRLAVNQALLLVASLAVFAVVAVLIRRVWTPPLVARSEVLAR